MPDAAVIDLHCQLKPDQAAMHIAAAVTYPSAKTATTKATFILADQMEAPKVVVLEPKEIAGPADPVKTVTRGHDVTYSIDLAKAVPAGERLKVSFDYSSKEPKGFVYLLSSKECLAGGYNTCWFPSVGNSRHMLGRLEFQSPSGYIVKASGKEVDAGEREGVRTTHFQMEQPIVPTFAAAKFVVTHAAGTVPMTLYLLKERPVAQEYAQGCSRILDVLTKQNGPYPFPDFSIIETPSPESGRDLGFSGASFEGFMFGDSDAIDGGFSIPYYGHEIGHQWWGNLIGNAGPKGAYMLSEALAQYGSLQCVDQMEGPAMAARYRSQGHPGYNDRQCARGAISYGPTGADLAMSALPQGHSPVYHGLANAKGFLVWDSIAREIGRERFHRALRAVTSKYAWGQVTFDQFLDEVRKAAGRNIDSILSQWLDRTGAPVLWSDWKQTGASIHVTVQQTEPAYSLELPVVIEFGDGSRMVKRVDFATKETAFEVSASSLVTRVEVDPNWEVFHSTPDLQAEAIDLTDYTKATFARMRGNEAEAEAACIAGLTRVPAPDKHATSFGLHLVLASVYHRAGKNAEAKEQYEAAIASPTRNAELLPWAYFGLGQALQGIKDEKEAASAFANAEAADSALPFPTGVKQRIATIRKG